MARAKRPGRRLILVTSAMLLALAVAELLALVWLHWLASDDDFQTFASREQLRSRYGQFERFSVHRHLGFAVAPGYERGANRHNRLGFRGEDFALKKPEGVIRIVCCGGSTTYGEGVLDHNLSMPRLLELGLRAQGHEVEVINAGCPGWTTLETLINFETRLLELEPDWVVLYHGINDVLPRLVWPRHAYRADLSGWLTRDGYRARQSVLEASALARILLVKSGAIEPAGSLLRVIGDVPETSRSFGFRTQRLDGNYPRGAFVTTGVEQMLAANPPVFFERNLESFLAVGQAHGVRVVLNTFAFSREFGKRPYVGHPAVQGALDEANAIVRRLAEERGVPLIEMAALSGERELFTDGVHFTTAGNVKRAQLLAAFFLPRLRE